MHAKGDRHALGATDYFSTPAASTSRKALLRLTMPL
jgi:hypothetical protein